nr:hypothetical protein BaRGS_028431 [Batillaria attramentaria]
MNDLLVGVMCVLTDLLTKITVEWHAGAVMCKLISYLQVTVTYVSTYILVSLSLDRYDAVARPMNFSRRPLVFALPTLFLYKLEKLEKTEQCWIDFPEMWHWKV